MKTLFEIRLIQGGLYCDIWKNKPILCAWIKRTNNEAHHRQLRFKTCFYCVYIYETNFVYSHWMDIVNYFLLDHSTEFIIYSYDKKIPGGIVEHKETGNR